MIWCLTCVTFVIYIHFMHNISVREFNIGCMGLEIGNGKTLLNGLVNDNMNLDEISLILISTTTNDIRSTPIGRKTMHDYADDWFSIIEWNLILFGLHWTWRRFQIKISEILMWSEFVFVQKIKSTSTPMERRNWRATREMCSERTGEESKNVICIINYYHSRF